MVWRVFWVLIFLLLSKWCLFGVSLGFIFLLCFIQIQVLLLLVLGLTFRLEGGILGKGGILDKTWAYNFKDSS